jgi:HlyD family secretion protein
MNMNYETSISSPMSSEFLEARDENDIQRKRRWIIIGAVALVLILGVAIAMYLTGGTKADTTTVSKAKEGQAQSVTVIAPGRETVVRAINATGTLAARREVPVGVVGEGGQVSHVYVDAGDWVRQGQVMASIDRSVQVQQAAALEAQIGVARADAQLAQNELDRALQLVQRGFISKADVDRKTSARDSARARVNVANAQLSETRARNARLDIRAPVAGYVLERTVQVGQTVAGGSGTLFRLAKDGEMELQAQLGESDLASVSEGVPATITPVGDTRQFNGQIWQVSPVINPQSRQGIARISLPFDRALRPGGFASVEIKAGAITAPILPESAVQNDANGAFVYIVGKANKVERRAVKTGTVTASGLAIMEGLDGSERVVLYSGGFLNPGETINPTTKKKTP